MKEVVLYLVHKKGWKYSHYFSIRKHSWSLCGVAYYKASSDRICDTAEVCPRCEAGRSKYWVGKYKEARIQKVAELDQILGLLG